MYIRKLNRSQSRNARRLIHTFNLLKTLAPRMSISDVMVLLSVAMSDEQENYKVHGQRTNISKAAMTKIAARLGRETTYGKAGAKLLEERPDPLDGRSKIPYLTKSGQGFVDLILESDQDDTDD